MKNGWIALTWVVSSLSLSQQQLPEGLYALIQTSKGEITVALEYERVPMTTANFVALSEGKMKYKDIAVEQPFFDGLTFHRVIQNFMIQGGDPSGNGSGGPGYAFPDEFDTALVHSGAGILSMANSGPNTNGSQFFITHKATPWLDGKHAVFGRVTSGQEVVDAIAQGDVIKAIVIKRIGKKAKKFNASKVFNKSVAGITKEAEKNDKAKNKAFKKEMKAAYPKAVQTKSGLMYLSQKKGDGAFPKTGQTVKVHYTGKLTNGEQFDSSVDRGTPFEFQLGQGRVIKGWDEGIPLVRLGGKITLIIPYWMAYGERARPSIPAKSHLIFDVELLGIR